MPSTISLADFHRVLFGNSPPVFLFEVFVRTLVAYVGIVAVLRMLGARVAGQFTLFEVSVAVTIAAAVGGPLQSTDRGMLPAVVMVVMLIVLQHFIAWISTRRKRVQRVMTSPVTLFVKDGVMQLPALRRSAISREQVFANLRGQAILQLGEVARLYMEPSGKFTVIRAAKPSPGLCIVPSFDESLRRCMQYDNGFACANCGHMEQGRRPPWKACQVCGADQWQPAARMQE